MFVIDNLSLSLILVIILWLGASITIILPIKLQLFILWSLLPFADMLKRMVFLDPKAGTLQMYLVLATQDIILLTILIKIVLNITHNSLKIRLSRVDRVMLLFMSISLLSALITPGPPLSARLATVAMWVWPIIAYFLFANKMSSPKDVHRLLKLTVFLGIIVALYGMYQFFVGFLPHDEAWFLRSTGSTNIAHMTYDLSRGVFRTFGTLDSHSSYGIYLGIALVCAWALRRQLGWFLWLAASLVITIGLVLSFTRFTWLMPVLAFGFIFLFSYTRIRPFLRLTSLRRASWLLLAVIGSFFVFYLMMNSLYGQKFFTSASPYLNRAFGTGTLEARLQASNILSGGIKLSPLGEGLASSGFFARKFGYENQDVNYHNLFIDLLDSQGIIGLATFVWFLYLLFKQSTALLIVSPTDQFRRELVAILSLIIAMIIVGHFNGAVFHFGRALPVIFWAFCGILSRDSFMDEGGSTTLSIRSGHGHTTTA